MNLNKKVVLVTGAGKGIGLNLVSNLLNYGAIVYCIIRSKNDYKKIANLPNCYIVVGDIKKTSSIKKIFNLAKKNNHYINCLVNNAGLRQRVSFNNLDIKKLREIFEINFFAQFLCIKEFLKNYKSGKELGSIINIGSIVGQVGFDELAGYASTKSALIGLTKSLAVELSLRKIRCNVVSPGFIKTSFFKNFKKNKKLYNWTIHRTPMKRWGETNEVSELISFLVSDNSSYINGEIINVDGGWLGS